MTAIFQTKNIDHERTLAEIIADARIRKGVSLEEAARSLRIQPHHLQAFEDGHLDALPGEVYARKYLERYARYLGLPAADVRLRLERSLQGGLWVRTPRPIKVSKGHFTVWPRRIRWIAVTAVILTLAGYFFFHLFARMQPPPLAIAYPPDGLITHVESLVVSGKTEPEARLTVNGAAVPVDRQGRFAISLNLTDGINYIRLTATRRWGKQRVAELKIVRE